MIDINKFQAIPWQPGAKNPFFANFDSHKRSKIHHFPLQGKKKGDPGNEVERYPAFEQLGPGYYFNVSFSFLIFLALFLSFRKPRF